MYFKIKFLIEAKKLFNFMNLFDFEISFSSF